MRRQHALAVCFLPYSRLKTFWTCVRSQLNSCSAFSSLLLYLAEEASSTSDQTSSFPSSQQLPVLVTAQTPASSPASSSSITEAQSRSGRTKPVQIGTFQFHVRLSASSLARCSPPPRTNKTVLTWEHFLVLIIAWWSVSVRKIWARNVKSCHVHLSFLPELDTWASAAISKKKKKTQ